MRSNDRLRALWRSVASPTPTRGVDFDALAARITSDATRALRATRWTRAAATAGIAAGIAAAVAIVAIVMNPTRPQPTLLEAVSGGETRERSFEVAVVGPRDGTWVIAAAVGTDR